MKDLPAPEPAGLFLTAILSEVGPEGWLLARAGLADLSDPSDPAALLRLAAALDWRCRPHRRTMTGEEAVLGSTECRCCYDRLGFDMAPSYVAGGILVRGDVPPVVLERYLGE